MQTLKNRTLLPLHDSVIEWILKHISVVYAIEILLAALLCLYGITSENGFRACGY